MVSTFKGVGWLFGRCWCLASVVNAMSLRRARDWLNTVLKRREHHCLHAHDKLQTTPQVSLCSLSRDGCM